MARTKKLLSLEAPVAAILARQPNASEYVSQLVLAAESSLDEGREAYDARLREASESGDETLAGALMLVGRDAYAAAWARAKKRK